MIRNLAALIVLAVFASGSFCLSTQSVDAKTSRNNSRRASEYFVPPPPPYTPSIVLSAMDMTNAQALLSVAPDPVVDKSSNLYGKYIFKRNQSDTPQVVLPNPHLSYDPGVETRVQKHIDHFDSEISSIQKEISKLLNL